MSTELDPDRLSELRREFARGFPDFETGSPLAIVGLLLAVHQGRLTVSSFTEKYFIQNVTLGEAKNRIALLKIELTSLFSLFPKLRELVEHLPRCFQFCYDDGKSAVLLAEEIHGVLRTSLETPDGNK